MKISQSCQKNKNNKNASILYVGLHALGVISQNVLHLSSVKINTLFLEEVYLYLCHDRMMEDISLTCNTLDLICFCVFIQMFLVQKEERKDVF